ncbi:50S ribosomal protein L17 [Longibacter sp.]|jgi:large subunit ribosomal protein L17|uniref:50S ribosomal protein L17 n=1 Tax=Longibacter sp. TaxID=2045415 RepID=UPI003EBDDC3D
MRHRKKGKKLGRTSAHRKSTMQSLSSALIEHKQIRTTVAKAKALRPFIEPLITRAKDDTEHNRRQVFRRLQNKEAVKELFNEVGVKVGDRPGGYVRIVKLGRRSGDGTEEAVVELVDYNDVQPSTAGSGKSSTRRGSGKGRREETEETEEAAAGAA